MVLKKIEPYSLDKLIKIGDIQYSNLNVSMGQGVRIKTRKYENFISELEIQYPTYEIVFVPFVLSSAGVLCQEALDFIVEISQYVALSVYTDVEYSHYDGYWRKALLREISVLMCVMNARLRNDLIWKRNRVREILGPIE